MAVLLDLILPPQAEPVATPPAYDALAVALAQQSNAISAQSNYLTFATMALGLVAILLAVGWGLLVKVWAERAANDAVKEWMDQKGTQIVADHVAKITPNRVDGGPAVQPGLTQQQQENALKDDDA